MTLLLKKFDMGHIKRDRICLFVGKRGCGKTTLLKDLLWYNHDLPVGMVMSGTEESNSFYQSFIPNSWIYSDFNTAAFDTFMDTQKKVARQYNEGKFKFDPHSFLLLDDCLYNPKILKSTSMKNLFYNGRHYNILTLISAQYCMSMAPDMRNQVDYLFILKDNIRANRKRLFEHYFGMFKSLAEFNKVMDAVTSDYGALVLDNTQRSTDIDKCVFWYRAELRPDDWELGTKSLWKYHDIAYNKNYEDTDEDIKTNSKPEKQIVKID